MKIGLYFGTFNPIHVGHLIIANHIAGFSDLERVWLVVSPQNPLKKDKNLLSGYHRLALARVAVEENNKLHVSNIEFDLPKPSYTIDTLTYLREKYPQHEFSIIMGEDNLRTLHKWKNYEEIIKNYQIYVYPRALTDEEKKNMQVESAVSKLKAENTKINFCNAPIMNISATFIRNAIKAKKDVSYLLTEPVFKYLTEMHFYE